MFFCGKQAVAGSDFHPDLKVNLNGRTYPIGAQVVGAFGLAYPLWGDTETWKYGYVRAGLNLMTSAVVNRAGIEFQFFPISIAGITAGYDTGVRNFIPKWLDCNVYECTGRIDRKHVRLSLMAAAAGFSLLFVTRYEEVRGFGSAKPLFDDVSLLVANKNGEKTITLNPALLYKVSEKTSVGFASLYSRAIDTGGYSHLYGPVVNYVPDTKWNFLVGAGLNSSPVAHSAMCGFFLFQYNVKTSLGVVDLANRNAEKNAAIRDVSESRAQ